MFNAMGYVGPNETNVSDESYYFANSYLREINTRLENKTEIYKETFLEKYVYLTKPKGILDTICFSFNQKRVGANLAASRLLYEIKEKKYYLESKL